MVAGFRMKVRLVNVNQGADDEVGGAVLTGTTQNKIIPATIQYMQPSLILLEQGAEVKRLARVLVQPGSLTIFEKDEIEVVGPQQHEDVGKRFRVESVDRTGLSPNDRSRRTLVLTCERIEEGRTTQQ